MLDMLAAAGAGVAYGAAHGLGPDHCAALASLVVRSPRPHQAVALSLRFGAGHALALAVLGLGAAAFGFLIPESWERYAEIFGGGVLVILGLLLLSRREGTLFVHRHVHTHDGTPHAHWHMHLDAHRDGVDEHGHVHGAGIVGGALALSGVRALVQMLPPLLVAHRGWAHALTFALSFGAGVMLTMVILGLLFVTARKQLLTRVADAQTIGRRLAQAVGVMTVALGVAWMWMNAA